jgi:hypothetical protein
MELNTNKILTKILRVNKTIQKNKDRIKKNNI